MAYERARQELLDARSTCIEVTVGAWRRPKVWRVTRVHWRHFPELSRILTLQAVDALLIPVAAAGTTTKEVFTLELRAHAAFNSISIAAANRVSREGNKEY